MSRSESRPFDQIKVIDTHTGGEPTRVVIAGGPELGDGSMAERREIFRRDFDRYRSAIINEPRGSDFMVGALICEPISSFSSSGVIFFNNVGMLGMCGHGTMGVAVALAHAGSISSGTHQLETPVGDVKFELHTDKTQVTFENVPSYRYAKNTSVQVRDYGALTGDIAWGGNWFYLVEEHGEELSLQNLDNLLALTRSTREALDHAGITGANGQQIDHIELFSSRTSGAASKNFVLCPGGAWDRSPCGTGTSAKIACLAADGKLGEGEIWRQESTIGSIFAATYRRAADGAVIPRITGSAWVCAESTLLLDPEDPFCMGIGR